MTDSKYSSFRWAEEYVLRLFMLGLCSTVEEENFLSFLD
ncbi:hypothetical protein A2U01_0065123, partial [Trifolium medium]|nr:hypothetical protein [Trifolium medium]